MEPVNGGRSLKWLWCVIFTLSISPFLFYFHSSTLLCSKNVFFKGCSTNNVVHFRSNYSISPVPKSLSVSKNRSEPPIVQNTITENGVEPSNQTVKSVDKGVSKEKKPEFDPCLGKYIYIQNLPSQFNTDLLDECKNASTWNDMCPYISNEGLGEPLDNSNGIFTGKGWYATSQFELGIIFYHRMKQYYCLTKNSSLASAIYVPFLAGLEIARHLKGFNVSERDYVPLSLLKWVSSKPEWQVFGGRDHFMVTGRITWDFRRSTDLEFDWGNKLMRQPEAKNMTMLSIEASPLHGNDFAIPYPTYFHPSTDEEVFEWQSRMRRQKKKYLFSFMGNPRPNRTDSIRSQIIEQCRGSTKCKLLQCGKWEMKCHSPGEVIGLFQNSVFCLQPPGDSPTRRSAFDSILAGCIPVFFHPASAYVQYIWHLPRNYRKYSVFIPEDDIRNGTVNIETTLSKISAVDVMAMRQEVIRLIPKLLYAHPKAKMKVVEDAFDVAVTAVIQRLNEVRKMKEGWSSEVSYAEENPWKYNLVRQWDHFINFP